MAAASLSGASLTAVHRTFVDELPRIDKVLCFEFRRWPRRHRTEAIADARSATWHAWIGLIRCGRDPREVGPTGIAYNAARYVKAGRKLGCGSTGRSAIDVYDLRARRRLGRTLISIDSEVDEGLGEARDTWREWLAADHRTSPAEEASFRVDFAAWLEALPPRKRRIAELLAEGHETGLVADVVAVSSGRVSQIRSELAESWGRYQAQALAV